MLKLGTIVYIKTGEVISKFYVAQIITKEYTECNALEKYPLVLPNFFSEEQIRQMPTQVTYYTNNRNIKPIQFKDSDIGVTVFLDPEILLEKITKNFKESIDLASSIPKLDYFK